MIIIFFVAPVPQNILCSIDVDEFNLVTLYYLYLFLLFATPRTCYISFDDGSGRSISAYRYHVSSPRIITSYHQKFPLVYTVVRYAAVVHMGTQLYEFYFRSGSLCYQNIEFSVCSIIFPFPGETRRFESVINVYF